MTERSNLSALVDGKAMPEEEARALWQRFSEHMDERRGDAAGFARENGWHEVRPEYQAGRAVLIVSTKPGSSPRPSSGLNGASKKRRKKR